MAIQMIFCLETNKRANTDYIYISETINYFYIKNNKTKFSQVYMNTKTKYNSKDTLKEIDKKTKEYRIGETKVIYCIDMDDYDRNAEHKKEFDNISQFCKENNYDLIWFCRDIEDVFVGKKVSDSEKVQMAGDFRRKRKIEEMNQDKLFENNKRVHTSNMLRVLDRYLSRK